MTLTEQAIATIAAGCEDWPDLPVTDAELLRIRNECEHNDGQIKIWAKMLQMIVDHVRATRSRLDPATVLALCALAQEALQSRREGQQMREALDRTMGMLSMCGEQVRSTLDALMMLPIVAPETITERDLRIEQAKVFIDLLGDRADTIRALSHPKPESVKT